MFKSKLDNKGFAVSSVLYTLLVAFLLFLGAALAEFSTSAKLLSKANEDLTDGLAYDIKAVYYENGTIISSVSINNPSEFPYWPNKPTKPGSTFGKFLSYPTNGGASYEDSASLYCKVKGEDKSGIYELPIKYGAIKNFAKKNCDGGDVEIRYTANFKTNKKSILNHLAVWDTSVFGNSKITRDEIETIEFKGTIDVPKDIPASNMWDASDASDASDVSDASLNKENFVIAYYTVNDETKLYNVVIGGYGKVQFPPNSSHLFKDYTELKTITFGDYIDTSNVTNMSGMFDGCSSLTSLDVSKFDTSNVTDMSTMFSRCSNLTSLDVSKFDTSKVTNLSGMFSGGVDGRMSLKSLDLTNFKTSNVTDISMMFESCTSIEEIKGIETFDTSKVTKMLYSRRGLFQNCKNLKSLDLSNWKTNNVTDMSYMFDGCFSLTSLNIKNFTFDKVKFYSSMLSDVPSSAIIYVKNQTAYDFINGKRTGGCTANTCKISY